MHLLVTETQPTANVGSTIRRSGLEGKSLVESGTRIDGWIDQHPFQAFALLSALYAAVVCSLSSMKLLWLDELITLHIARLNSAGTIWRALSEGADPNPPLIHLAVMFFRRLFGERELAMRLPAIMGYWLGMLTLFLFLKRRLSATWALAGTLLSMANAAFDYSFESRSYGVFYGFAMASLFCWSYAIDAGSRPHSRRLAWLGMVAALSLGISTNYFAVLAFLPVAGGELVRTWEKSGRRRSPRAFVAALDWPIWIGVVLAATPMLAYRPLIERSIAHFAPHAWNKVSLDQVTDSYTQMVEYVLYPLLALFCLALAVRTLAAFCARCQATLRPRWLGALAGHEAASSHRTFPLHEMAATFLFMAYPILGYLMAKVHGGMLSPRFVIPVCLGFAIMGTAVSFRLFGHLRLAKLIMLLFCLAWFVSRESFIGYTYNEQKQCFYKVIDHFPQDYATGPIVISDPLMVLTFQHYAPAQMVQRIVYPVDFPAIRGYRGDDSPEQNIWAGRNTIYHVSLMPLSELQSRAGEYVILAADGNWLVEVLKAHSYPVDRLPIDTRADALGGFTPLAHGVPAYFAASGDLSPRTALPFSVPPWHFDPAAGIP